MLTRRYIEFQRRPGYSQSCCLHFTGLSAEQHIELFIWVFQQRRYLHHHQFIWIKPNTNAKAV